MKALHLTSCLGILGNVINSLPADSEERRRLSWLQEDLDQRARPTLHDWRHSRAWDRLAADRLEAIGWLPHADRETQVALMQLKVEFRIAGKGEPIRPLFGQQRIAPAFQNLNNNQADVLGFPDSLANRTLEQVREALVTREYLPDQIPVQIFWHTPPLLPPTWVAANNRSYTAHCLADVRPLRLWPTLFPAAAVEVTRLQEQEDQGDIGRWTGFRDGAPYPRVLPSRHMFVVANIIHGGGQIDRVASVPGHWN